MPMVDPVMLLVVVLSLALLWIVAAAHKLRGFAGFSVVLADYRLVPKRAAHACAVAVIAMELGLGTGLLIPAMRSFALAGSALLLVTYAAAIAVNLVRGRRFIDCGCMGPVGHQPLSGWLVARNLSLALLALAALLPVQGRALVWLDAVTVAAAIGSAALLYAAANRLIANGPDLARLRI